jgi:hypothetical protein
MTEGEREGVSSANGRAFQRRELPETHPTPGNWLPRDLDPLGTHRKGYCRTASAQIYRAVIAVEWRRGGGARGTADGRYDGEQEAWARSTRFQSNSTPASERLLAISAPAFGHLLASFVGWQREAKEQGRPEESSRREAAPLHLRRRAVLSSRPPLPRRGGNQDPREPRLRRRREEGLL